MLNKHLKILLTGSSGLLSKYISFPEEFGTVLKPSHEEFDITKFNQISLSANTNFNDIDLIVHLAAFTNVEKAEIQKSECFLINTYGTLNLLSAFPNVPFVFMSTEYAYKPVNFYSLTKNLAEQVVTTAPNYLIIRTLFKDKPWKQSKAFIDKYTMGDYVDIIGPLVVNQIINWFNTGATSRLVYIGTGRKTYYDLARATKPDVIPNSIKEIRAVRIPQDYR